MIGIFYLIEQYAVVNLYPNEIDANYRMECVFRNTLKRNDYITSITCPFIVSTTRFSVPSLGEAPAACNETGEEQYHKRRHHQPNPCTEGSPSIDPVAQVINMVLHGSKYREVDDEQNSGDYPGECRYE